MYGQGLVNVVTLNTNLGNIHVVHCLYEALAWSKKLMQSAGKFLDHATLN
jgi:hypothetical protein